jgi:branched-chain amino acid transport system ATP-binding protein
MLRVEKLRKAFDGFQAVAEADLEVDQGEIVAVIGPNGAGKSTLFKLITGVLKPDAGRILYHGQNLAGLPPHKVVKKGLSLSYQVVNVFSRLTVFENVQASVLAHQNRVMNVFAPAENIAVDRTLEILANVGLTDRADAVSGALSHGDQKVLEMAIALGSSPELLILDEPTAGMSPEETAATIDLINHLTSQLGLTILFCEHDMELVFALAHRIMVMHQGRTIIQGACDDVKCDVQVQEAYLGGSA